MFDWMDSGSLNSLDGVYQFYCNGEQLDKTNRDVFVKGTIQDINNDFQVYTATSSIIGWLGCIVFLIHKLSWKHESLIPRKNVVFCFPVYKEKEENSISTSIAIDEIFYFVEFDDLLC